MIQFKILSGNKAGTVFVARRFPVRLGRSAQNDLQLDDPGVWDEHASVRLDRATGFVFTTEAEAFATLNGEPVQEVVLRNGDEVGLGAARLQFWLTETRQSGLRFRESLTWVAIAAISLCQVALIYFLLR